MKPLILATTSPYRIKAFKSLGIPFTTESSEVDEYSGERPPKPAELVQHLARKKAEAVAPYHSDSLILGFDSVAEFEGQILEKPRSLQEAFDRLFRLSGNTHMFYTGIHAIDLDGTATRELSEAVVTRVEMRHYNAREIARYLREDPHYNTYALGYAPEQHYSASFVARIEGSYNNLISGIPLEVVVEMLASLGYGM